MKYIGQYPDFDIPVSQDKYGILYCYAKESIEVRIYYNKECPFLVEYIAILIALTETYSTYQVYEYNYYSQNIEELKEHIIKFVEGKIDEIQRTHKE